MSSVSFLRGMSAESESVNAAISASASAWAEIASWLVESISVSSLLVSTPGCMCRLASTLSEISFSDSMASSLSSMAFASSRRWSAFSVGSSSFAKRATEATNNIIDVLKSIIKVRAKDISFN